MEERGFIEKRIVTQLLEQYLQSNEITYDFISNGFLGHLVNNCMTDVNDFIKVENYYREKAQRLKYIKNPTVQMVTLFLAACDDISMVRYNECDEYYLFFRIRDPGSDYDSIWVRMDSEKFLPMFDRLIVALNPEADSKFRKEVRQRLQIELLNQKRTRTAIRDGIHVPCRNGVYDRKNHTFISWYADNFDEIYKGVAFTYKLQTNYYPNAYNAVITTDCNGNTHPAWDFESHVKSLFDDNAPDVCDLCVKALWQVMSHVISGYSEKYIFFFTNTSGNSKGGGGKSAILHTLRNIIGMNKVTSININKMTTDKYAMAMLLDSVANLSDEVNESSSASICDYDDLKMMVSNEPIIVREIYHAPVRFKPNIPFIQATNANLRFQSTTESLFRRLKVLPFEKSFVHNGVNATEYLKDDYLVRPIVAEYILKKILQEIPIDYTEDVLEFTSSEKSMMKNSFPVTEFMDNLTEDYNIILDIPIIPAPLLYDMYLNYQETQNHHQAGNNLSSQNFWKQILSWTGKNSDWEIVTGTHRLRGCDLSIHAEVFRDYGPNTGKRTWARQGGAGVLYFIPSTTTFRNGIRYVGTPPKNTWLYVNNVLIPDKSGEWHQEYETVFKPLFNMTELNGVPVASYEAWVNLGCPNTFDYGYFGRVNSDGVKLIVPVVDSIDDYNKRLTEFYSRKKK